MTKVQANVTSVMGQSAVGYVVGNFVLILSVIFLVPNRSNVAAVLFVPLLLIFGALISVPAGLAISVASQLAHRPLNMIFRAAIGIAIVAFGWVILAVPFGWSPLQLWVLGATLAPGIGIGLVTGSRLRLWRELIRQGDLVGPVLRVFAALSGFVLRVAVASLFMVSCIALISILQSSDYQRIDRIWAIVAFAHFAVGLTLLLVRMKTAVLLPLAVILNAPLVVRLFTPPQLEELIPYVAIAYLELWAIFLVTRWRQTQTAVSVLEDEFRYYLIE